MARIHVRGGSPLRLKFEDDDGSTLDVRLDVKGQGEYFVIDEATNKKLQVFGDPGKPLFTEKNTPTSCEISYKGRAPAPATA